VEVVSWPALGEGACWAAISKKSAEARPSARRTPAPIDQRLRRGTRPSPHVLDSSQSKIICGGRISSRQRHASKITIYAAVLGVHGLGQMCGRDGELVLDARQCDVHARVVQHLQ
jgi:hypothetical protein